MQQLPDRPTRNDEFGRGRAEGRWLDARPADSWVRGEARGTPEWLVPARAATHLLLVDGHDASRSGLAGLLRGEGYAVVEARDCVEGLRIAREGPPALAIVDPWPTYAAALEMLRLLGRERPADEIVPVLALSAPVPPAFLERAAAAGCRGFLEKPCPAATVLAEVRRVLGAPALERMQGGTHVR